MHELYSTEQLLAELSQWDESPDTDPEGKDVVTIRLYKSIINFFKAQSRYTERIRNVLYDYVNKSQETSNLLAEYLHGSIDAIEDDDVIATVSATQFPAERTDSECIKAVKRRLNQLTDGPRLYEEHRVFHNTDLVPFFVELPDRTDLGYFEISATVSNGTFPKRPAFSQFSKIIHKRGLYLSFIAVECGNESEGLSTHLICKVSGKIFNMEETNG
jgi:hypothetical protein